MKKIHFVFVLYLFIIPFVSFASINLNLQYGSKGKSVVELQNFLIGKGFFAGEATGNFFGLTKKAVVAYQKSLGLPTTGFVGPMTRAKINTELSQIGVSTTPSTNIGATTKQEQINALLSQLQELNARIQAQTTTQQQTQTINQQNATPQISTTVQPNSSWTTIPSTAIDSKLIQWSSARKLTWSDFQKTPPSSYDPEAALITTQLSVIPGISHRCETVSNLITCTFRLDSVQVAATMDPRLSWVKLSSDLDYVLAHEQIHFDIAELFARKLRAQLVSQVNTTTIQTANSADYIIKAYNVLFAQKQKTISDEMSSLQSLYDSDTDHGKISSKQAAWAGCVANWLNNNLPITTCQMPTASTQTTVPTTTTQPNTSNNANFLITRLESADTGAVPVVGINYVGDIGFSTNYEIAHSNQIRFTLTGLPPGLVANNYLTMIQFSNQGYVEFKGVPAQTGTFPVTITFTDNNTFNVSKTFYLTVYSSPQAPSPTPNPNPSPAPIPTPIPTPTPAPVVSCTPSTNSNAPSSTTNDVGTITVTSPNSGECLKKGSSQTITWSSSNNIDKVTIFYVSIFGTTDYVASNVPNTGSYTWNVNVGNTTNTQFKIKILGYQTGLGSVSDTSDGFFTVN